MFQNYLSKFSHSKVLKVSFQKISRNIQLTAEVHYIEHHKAHTHLHTTFRPGRTNIRCVGRWLGDFVSCMISMFDDQNILIKKITFHIALAIFTLRCVNSLALWLVRNIK